jgi:ATP-dependent exoDNAse (exonuclease V) alpha subunit
MNGVAEIEAAWNAARQSDQWRSIFIEREIEGKQVLYLASEHDYEKTIAQKLFEISKTKKKPLTNMDGTRFIKSICGLDFDIDQARVLNLIQDHPIVLVNGGPGSGKTTVSREVNLQALHGGVILQGMAFLGKAAARMRQHAGIAAHTIHRVITKKGGKWEDVKGDPVKAPDIIVIDEAAKDNTVPAAAS